MRHVRLCRPSRASNFCLINALVRNKTGDTVFRKVWRRRKYQFSPEIEPKESIWLRKNAVYPVVRQRLLHTHISNTMRTSRANSTVSMWEITGGQGKPDSKEDTQQRGTLAAEWVRPLTAREGDFTVGRLGMSQQQPMMVVYEGRSHGFQLRKNIIDCERPLVLRLSTWYRMAPKGSRILSKKGLCKVHKERSFEHELLCLESDGGAEEKWDLA